MQSCISELGIMIIMTYHMLKFVFDQQN